MSTKVKCECGLYVNEVSIPKHTTSKTHLVLLERRSKKLESYNAMKDAFNCCSVCLKTNVDDLYYKKDLQICFFCDAISRRRECRCKNCKQLVEIASMERPYLIRCKACANNRLAKLVKCKICDVDVKLHDMSKHLHRKHQEEKKAL